MNLRIVASVLFLVTATAASATVYSCGDPSLQYRLQELYAYTLFVEAAENGSLPDWRCMDDNATPVLKPPDWDSVRDGGRFGFQPLSGEELTGLGWTEIVDSFRTRHLHIGAYEHDRSGRIYMVCDRSPGDVMYFLTWSAIRPNIDNSAIRPFNFVLGVHAVDMVVNANTMEGLQQVTFHMDEDLLQGDEDFYPQTVTAVPGTNFNRTQEVGTSVMDLHERSCLFELMLELAQRVLAQTQEPYAFAGHSLGGSVAQYVAQQVGLWETEFKAYAFNGIGLNVHRGRSPMNLDSFYISGDPVVALGASVGRTQGAAIVEYTPPNPTGFQGRLEHTWEVLTFWWHRRPGVQQALCDCMNGRGSLRMSRPGNGS